MSAFALGVRGAHLENTLSATDFSFGGDDGENKFSMLLQVTVESELTVPATER